MNLLPSLKLPMMMYGIFKTSVPKMNEDGSRARDKKGRALYQYKNKRYTKENSIGVFPTVNHAYVNTKGGGKRLAKGAMNLMDDCFVAAQLWADLNGWTQTSKEKVLLEITPFFPKDGRSRDSHNAIKMIMDALEGVIYENDNKALPRIMDLCTVDEETPYFEILIYKQADEDHILHERYRTRILRTSV